MKNFDYLLKCTPELHYEFAVESPPTTPTICIWKSRELNKPETKNLLNDMFDYGPSDMSNRLVRIRNQRKSSRNRLICGPFFEQFYCLNEQITS
jgi:hypothetical protein